MRINSLDFFILIALLLTQTFLASFEALLILSVLLGAVFNKANFSFIRWFLIELVALIILALLNGLNTVSLEQFAELLSLPNSSVLVIISVLVSAISVALPARTASLILNFFLLKRSVN